MAAIDGWTGAAIVAFPVWIFVIITILGQIVRWSCSGAEWWRTPLYMALFTPIALIGATVPVGILARHIDRLRVYENCVTHENAQDPMNGCPQWTRELLAAKESQDG